MAEYIKRDDIFNVISIGRLEYPECDSVFDGMETEARRIPSADVAEVKRGEWELHGEPPWYVIECSKCGEKWHHWQGYSMPNFCPNCGCDMRQTKGW